MAAGASPAASDSTSGGPQHAWPQIAYPSRAAIASAKRFAAGYGDLSFAVIGSSTGVQGYDFDRQYSSASITKSMLLAAELRRLNRQNEPLDEETKSVLRPMITYSDNGAADTIYARVGDEGLEEVARRAGMHDFEAIPGFWGGDQVTAADMARYFHRLESNLPQPHRRYALHLLASISSEQRWGIPAAVGSRWSVWFKGGWRPAGEEQTSGVVTHQAALLRDRGGQRVAVAVLSDESPGGTSYGAIEGITRRLLARPPPPRSGWPVP